MKTINTYLTFNGDCEEAFNFYQSVFGGEFSSQMRFDSMPPSDKFKIPEEQAQKIMHMSLPMGDTVLMGSDTFEAFGPPAQMGNNFSVSASMESKEEADKIFKALSEGGKVTMPLADAFWNSYFGSLTDKFGINWMVAYDYPAE